jgi:dTDP-4-amino-4,6-dideoxygalactose transaminase
VAANLFGISERLDHLRPIAERAGVVLIEDSAQAFPGGGETSIWKGDLVVLSFGRGKPVSLLGGGAVLFRESAWRDLLPRDITSSDTGAGQWVSFRLKAAVYNRMISPWLYWLPQSLPFLHLGETRYHTLPDIEAMDAVRQAVLPGNLAVYRHDDMAVQKALAEGLDDLDLAGRDIIDLPKICRTPPERRLLRYPLLIRATDRDRLYEKLKHAGLGPSGMYPAALPGICGLKELLAEQGPFPAAELFSTRILTLPTHHGVRQVDIGEMCRVLGAG